MAGGIPKDPSFLDDVKESAVRVDLLALEPRVLYDASPLGVVAADLLESADHESQHLYSPDDAADELFLQSVATHDDLDFSAVDFVATDDQANLDLSFQTLEQAQQLELVIVDSQIENIESLIADLKSGWNKSGTSFDVLQLDQLTDGIQQVSEHLEQSDSYSALHIFSHGSDGALQLGLSELNSDNLSSYQQEIESWSDSLTTDADILLYGCEVAFSDYGESFVEQFALMTETNVAASSDLTGQSSLGGDWILEYAYGEVDTQVVVSAQLQASWSGVLDITTGLVGHYEFEEGSGTTTADSSVNNNSGTLVASPSWSTGVYGGGGIDFAADFDRIEVPDNPALNFGTTDFSVGFWFNSTQIPGGSARLAGQATGAGGFVFYSDAAGDVNFFVIGSAANSTTSEAGLLDGLWHQVTGVRSGDTFELYVDGTLRDTSTVAVGNVGSTAPMRFGSSTPTSSEYDGSLDDVRIYDRALTAADASELYGTTSTIEVTTTSDLVNGDTRSFAALLADDGGDGISLREAMQAANNSPNGATPDEIFFNIPNSDANYDALNNSFLIQVSSELPFLDEAVIIDATTQLGWDGTPSIDLDGSLIGGMSDYGFTSDQDEITIRGFAIGNFSGAGIYLEGSGDHTIQSNYIGTDVTGAFSRANGIGIHLGSGADSTLIGGAVAGQGNLIAGNTNQGVLLDLVANSTLYGNFIGTDYSGLLELTNGSFGIDVVNSSLTNVGGSLTTQSNVIGGYLESGINLSGAMTSNTRIRGNFIGTDLTGSLDLTSGSYGITIQNGASNALIGNSGANDGNAIAFNSINGIRVVADAGSGNSFLSNLIHDNGDIGIDLAADGVTVNDLGDGDSGANELQNFPVINAAVINGGTVTISGEINSAPSTSYRIQFFASATGDNSGFGEAERLLDTITVVTDATGNAIFEQNIIAAVGAGELVTATATDIATGNTSEFSQNVAASQTGAIAIWNDNGASDPDFNLFDGVGFGTEGATAGVGNWSQMEAAEAPTRDEAIVIGINNKTIRGQMWDGTSWTTLPLNDLGNAKIRDTSSFDVAYETQSGDAVLVWQDNPALMFSVWDGASWTTPATIAGYTGAEPDQISLASSPNSDEIVVVISDNNNDDYALVWDGSAWGDQVLLTTVNSQDITDVSVVYEGQSGQAMVVYAKDQTDVHFRTWDGTGWSAEGTITAPSGAADMARWTTLASDPSSDQIVLGVMTEAEDAYFAIWDGSAWVASESLFATADTNDKGVPNIAVAFESNTGEALVVYAVEDTAIRYRTWDATSGWSGELTGPDIGSKPTSMTLESDPDSNLIMLSTLDEGRDVNFVLWNGLTWGTPSEQETNSGGNSGMPFAFLWNQENKAPVLYDTNVVLDPIAEDAAYPAGAVGTLISNVADLNSPSGGQDNVGDSAGAMTGVAITGADETDGTWFYSIDGGTNWVALGAVSESSAVVLAADGNTRVYFQPGANYHGTIPSALTFRAWDQTDGVANGSAGIDTTLNGGTTSFSIDTDTASLDIIAVNDAPIAVDDHFGLDFDGQDDYVTIADSASLTMSNTMTMEAWINADASTNVNRMIINKEGEYEVALFPDNTIRWAFANTVPAWSWHDTGFAVTNGEWTHIAVSYDNGTVTTYVNGTAVEVFNGSGSIGDAHPTFDELRIGGRTNSPDGKYFDGQIDDVRIWNVVRSQSEIQAAMGENLVGNESGLVGYWNFNEGSGVSAADLTSFNNDGTLADGAGLGTPMPTWTGYSTDQDTQLTIAAGTGVLSNDTDIEGDTLAVSQVNGNPANVGTMFTIPSGANLTLEADGSFTYDPNGSFDYLAVGESAVDSFTYQIDDGNGGNDLATVYVTITGGNDAPTLTNGSLGAVFEDATNPAGQTVATIFAGQFSDVDNGSSFSGIAVVGNPANPTTEGAWEYSNDGTNWFSIGVVADDATALALDSSVLVRFVPVADYAGVPAALEVRGLDNTYAGGFTAGMTRVNVDTTVNGGSTAISAMTVDIDTSITEVNDAPVQTGGTVNHLTVSEDSGFTTLGFTGLTYGPGGGADEALQNLTIEVLVYPDPTYFGKIFLADGTTQVTTGFYSLGDLQGMQFQTVQDAYGGPSFFQWRIVDDGGTANGGQDTLSQFIFINITAVNDNPTIETNTGATFDEASTGNLISSVMLNEGDPDDSGTEITYQLDATPGNGNLYLSGSLLSLGSTFTQQDIDFGRITYDHNGSETTSDSFDFTIADGGEDGATTASGTFNLVINPINDAPVIDTTNLDVVENQIVAGTVTATDADLPGDTFFWSITGGGADDTAFTINSSTGELTFGTLPDFESPADFDGNNVYELEIQVHDGTVSTIKSITVTVTDQNEAPTDINPNSFSVDENVDSTSGVSVGTLTAVDEDAAETFTYSVVGGLDQASFSIGGSGLDELILADGILDFESQSSYDVIVRVTDSALNTYDEALTVSLNDLNDAPVITSNGGGTTASVNVAENSTAVTTVTASDQDVPADTLTFTITGGADAGDFLIDSSTGVLTFASGKDFETPTDTNGDGVYEVEVTVDDGNGATDIQTISVAITDTNEAPVITSDGGGTTASVNVGENTTAVTTVAASDQDVPADSLTFTITGGADAGDFVIDPSTGVLTFASGKDFETPTDTNGDGVYEVEVTVDDGNGGLDIQTISVSITDTNEAPVITSDGGGTTASVNVVENTTAVTTVTASDQDVPADSLTFTITGGADAVDFVIDPSTGVLTFVSGKDFETPTDINGDGVYEVEVTVDDGNGGTDIQTISVAITDTNEAPVITSDGGGTTASVNVSENTTAVTTVTASDQDVPADSLTFAITGGADAGDFVIDPSTGVLTFVSGKDFETPTDINGDGVYEVEVTVDDGNGGTDIQTISVSITDTNEAPVITSDGGGTTASVNVDENTTAVTTVTASDQDVPADSLTFTITGGADAGDFVIDPSTGVLTFASGKDFETPTDINGDGVYEVEVTVDDGNGGTDIQTISVSITDTNEAPVITSDGGGTTAGVNVAENTTAVTTVTASDQDVPADSLTFAITGGADAGDFVIDPSTGVLTFASGKDFETPTDINGDGVYEVEVTVDDGNGGTDIQTISVSITDTNEAPVITSDGGGTTASVNVSENTTAVTTVTASDQDVPADSLTFTITGGADAGDFVIDPSTGVLTFVSGKDFETPTDINGDGVYEVEVTVDDGNGGADIQTISVSITDTNEAPVITSDGGGTTASVNVDENTTAVTTVTASDQDVPADSLTFTITGGADAGDFVIDPSTGVLTFASGKDFETPTDINGDGVYEVEVTVDDGNGGTDIQTISVSITDTNEAPVITSDGGGTTAGVNVAENTTAVTTVTASDQDVPADSLTFAITGGADAGDFVIDPSTGVLTFASGKDFETPTDINGDGVYEVEVTVDDGNGGTDIQTISVSITDTNEAPIITSDGAGTTASVNVAENTTAVTTVTASDQDVPADSLTFTITGGADAVDFVIDPSTGVLTFASGKDFETPTDTNSDGVYEVEVTVDDGNGESDIQLISVTITGNNDAPVITSDGGGATASVNVVENSPAVTTVTASDSDVPSDILTFTITGGADAGDFVIDPSTGVLTFASGKDFETPTDINGDGVYEVEVTVDDGNGGTDIQTISVSVTDTNEAPVITSDGGGTTASVNVDENTTAVTTVTASDQDVPADSLTFTITGGADAGDFVIDPSTGVLTFASGKDFETPADINGDNVYEVEVTVDDGNGGLDIQTISVSITDTNEAPIITSDGAGTTASVNVAENTTAVTTVTASDQDVPADSLTFTITGGADAGDFVIDPSTGVLTFASGKDFETPTDINGDGVYEVEVTVDDGNGGADIQTISVSITDTNEAPVITSDGAGTTASVNVTENTTAVTTVTASDQDVPADSLTFTITGGADAGDFVIDPSTGVLTFASGKDFETPTDINGDNVYEVEVTVDDGNGGADIQTISVSVTDINEAPVINSDGGGTTASVNVDENTTAVTTVTASDQDVPADSLTFTITGGADAGDFVIDPSTGVLTFASGKDFETPTDINGDGVYEVEVTVDDGNGGADIQTISVSITDTNEAPVITSDGGGTTAGVNVAENTMAVTTVTASDQDVPADSLTFTITGGPDAGDFVIDPSTGVLTFASGKDFETPTDINGDGIYEVEVTVDDGNGGLDIQTISVSVTDTNEAPVITSDGGGTSASVNVVENTTAVTTVTASDQDVPADSLTFTITGGADAGDFVIDPSTGVLTFASGKDFETPTDINGDGVYEVEVTVDDGNGGADIQTISVSITDTNEAPVITSDGGGTTAGVNVAENTTAVTTVTASDQDVPADSLTFTITGGADAGDFVIDPSTGVLTFTSGKDFETPTDINGDGVYEVEVTVDDGNGGLDIQTISVSITDTNEAPVITSDGGGTSASVNVVENTTAVTTVTASDQDVPADSLTFTITGGADAGDFVIDPSTGVLTFASGKDFETPTDINGDGVYEVEVTVDDGNGGADIQTISVSITDSNEAPVITSDGGGTTASVNVAENTTAVTTVTASDQDVPADSLTFTITGGADAGDFVIDPSTGVLTFASGKDFETPTDINGDGVYEVEVTVDDGNGGADIQTISVSITDTNEAPVITSDGAGTTASVNVTENTTAVTTVTASDQDVPADSLTFTITGGADAGDFVIDPSTGVLTFASGKDFETPTDINGDGVYEVEVTVDDGNGGADIQTISVSITDTNEAPVITSDGGGTTASVNVAENTTAITTVTASDQDVPADSLTFTITGGADAGDFVIDPSTGVLTFTSGKDFETPTDINGDGIYEVEVTVDDGNGGTDIQTISVSVTDTNEAPAITSDGGGTTASVNVAENTTAVTTVTASDQDVPADSLTFTITGGADAVDFVIDPSTGVLTFASGKDFETPTDINGDGVYEVEVTVDDGNGGADIQTISVSITDTNEAPVITSDGAGTTASVNVTENTTAVTTVTASDQDVPADSLTFTITGGADAGDFVIDPSTGVLTFASGKDFETPTDINGDGVYEVEVTVDDGNGGADIQTISVSITDTNEAPVITSDGAGTTASVNVTENTTAVTTVTASDQDVPADSLTFTITGGADAGDFVIDPSTGVLTFASGKDFETPTDINGDGIYEVEVTVDDGNGGADIQTISVSITDTNEAPVITSNGAGTTASVNVAENTTAVTTVTASDQDAPADSLTFTITGGADAGDFVIDPSTGVLTFASGKDFETPTDINGDNVYEVEVTVDDGNGGADIQTISVSVTDINEAPVITSDGGGTTASVNVDENTTAVTTVTASDQDVPADSLTFTITGGADAGDFVIDPSTGVLTFASGKDFETPTDINGDGVYEVEVTVDDGNGGADIQTISVSITDTNEAPVITSDGGGTTAGVNVAENTTAVTTVTASDQDVPADSLTFTITGGADAGDFVIDPSTGVLTFTSGKDFETPTDINGDGVYEVEVTVDDGNGGLDIQTISVSITDTNEAPIITSNGAGTTASVNVVENTTAVTTVTASDQDVPADSLTFTITGGADAGDFVIDPSTGVLTFASGKDFETPTDINGDGIYEVEVTVDDGNGGTDIQTISVAITDANDAPIAVSDTATVNEGGTVSVAAPGVLGNDVDQDGDSLTATIASGPTNGAVVLNTDGSYTYTHDGSETTSDSFTYQVSDGNGGFDVETVNITIVPVNDAPVAAPETFSVDEAGTLTIVSPGVLGNDFDADGDVITSSLMTGPSNGSLVLNSDGSFTYVHDGSETTGDSFTYQVSDGNGGFDSETVTINVNPVNDDPVVVNNLGLIINEGDVKTIGNLLLRAIDVDSVGDITFTLVSTPSNGTLFVNGVATGLGGSFTQAQIDAGLIEYLHDDSNTTSDSFLFDVRDVDGGLVASQTFIITIVPVNDDPIALDDTYSVSEDGILASPFDVDANDTDPEGDSLTTSLISGPTNASAFTLNPDGSFVYTPIVNFNGTDTFVYQVSDGNGGLATATVTINVMSVNDAPFGTDDSGQGVVGEVLHSAASVLSNDSDIENDPLIAILVNPPANGTLLLNTDGSFSYTPNPGFVGLDSFAYVANDGATNGTPNIVTLEILAANFLVPEPSPEPSPDPEPTPEEIIQQQDVISDSGADDKEFQVTNQARDSLSFKAFEIVQGMDTESVFEEMSNRTVARQMLQVLSSEEVSVFEVSEIQLNSLSGPTMVFNIEKLIEGLDELELSDFNHGFEVTVGTVTVFATAGYIFWMLRGSVLLATLMSQLPSWQMIDPLPVLESYTTAKRETNKDVIDRFFD